MPKLSELKKKNCIILIVLLLCFVAAIVFAGRVSVADTPSVTDLTDHWRVILRGDYLTDVSLADANLGIINKGDTFLMSHALPEEEVTGAGIQMRTAHSTVRVYVGESLIYEDGAQYTAENSMTPTRFHFIALPEGYGGKTLTVHLISNENNAFSGLEPVRLGNIHDLYMRYLHSSRLTILVGIFLGVLGLVLLFCCLFLWIFYRSERRILYSSLITFLLGFYILAFNELPQFLNDTLVFDNFLEFFSLFYLPPAFIAFLGSVREKEKRRPYIYMALLDLVIATVIVLLHVFNIVHINNCVTLIHLLILSEGLLLIAMSVTQWVHDRRTRTAGEPWRISERVLMAGFFFMMVMAMIDIARYSFMRYFGAGGDAYANLNYTTTGAFLFAVCLILNFFYYHIERLYAEDMLQRLSGLAFTDPLTGMANRSRCEQMLERFDKEDFACTVISIDIDRLKIINDRHGHAAGDRYLADTAEILTRCFQDAELLGRMGGDEFIAVMSGTSMVKIDHSIDMLQELLAEKNTGPELFPYAMSYGVASTDEEHIHNVRDALREADLRMYSMKQAHHAAKEGT